ncbi:hypothetical protein ACNKHV_23600 [Shigella flexneri]
MMLPFLKAPADVPLMTDKHEIDARYRSSIGIFYNFHLAAGYALFSSHGKVLTPPYQKSLLTACSA